MTSLWIDNSVVRHEDNGLLARDHAEWVKSLDALLQSPELRRRYAEAGRRQIETDYSCRAVSRRLVELLRGVWPQT